MKYLIYKVFVVVFTLAGAAFSQSGIEQQAIILNDQGVSQFEKGKFQEAIRSFDRAIQLSPLSHREARNARLQVIPGREE